MQGMTERARSLQKSPYCHAPRQCKSACHVHHPVGTQDILRLDGAQRVADGGLGVVFAKVIGGPGQLMYVASSFALAWGCALRALF